MSAPWGVATSSRTLRDVEEAVLAAHSSSLHPHERSVLAKDERVRAMWEARQREWRRFQSRMSSKLQRSEEESVLAHADEYRAIQEELDLLERVRPRTETGGAEGWKMSLRGGGARYILVGNPFTGLWAPVKEVDPNRALLETVRQPKIRRSASASSSKLDDIQRSRASSLEHKGDEHAAEEEEARLPPAPRRGNGWRNAPELLRKKQQFAARLAQLRPHDVDDTEAEGLVITGQPLLAWAQRSLDMVVGGQLPSTLPEYSTEDGDITTAAAAAARGIGAAAFGVTLGAERDQQDEGLAEAEEHNAALHDKQMDLQRALLLAANKWIAAPPVRAAKPGSVLSGSYQGSVETPQGSMSEKSGTAAAIVRQANELLPGPHLHVQVVADSATTNDDIGAGVAVTGRLAPIRGGLKTLRDEADAHGGAGIVQFHPSWATSSLIMGHMGAEGMEMGSTQGGGLVLPHESLDITHASSIGGAGIATSAAWPHVVFEGAAGSLVTAKIRVANTGTTVLYYKWLPSPDPHVPVKQDALDFSATQPLGTATPVLPDKVPTNPRFLIGRPAGSLVPGAVQDFVFKFQSDAPGVFQEVWSLQTTPVSNGGHQVDILLRGVASAADELAPKRQRLEGRLRDAAVYAAVREVVLSIVDEFQPPTPTVTNTSTEADQRAAFDRLNPGLYYRPDIYVKLQECAQQAYEALNYVPEDRRWDGSVSSLVGVINQLIPEPETAEEAAQRERMEIEAAAAAKLAAEAEAKAKADAAEAEAAAKKGGKKPAAPAAASPPAGKRPPTAADGRRSSIMSQSSERPGTASSAIQTGEKTVSPAEARQARVNALRVSLRSQVSELVVAASQRPPERSPAWEVLRNMVISLAESIPSIAGGVKEAEALPFATHSVPGEEEQSWSDVRPEDVEVELLTSIYGRKGRPKPKIPKMRLKLGRDGEYHEVPVDEPEVEEESEGEDEAEAEELESLDATERAAREPWADFHLKMQRQLQKALAEADSASKAAAEAAAAAAAAAAAEAEAAAKKGGKKPPAAAPAGKDAKSPPPKGAGGADGAEPAAASAAPAAAAPPVALVHPMQSLLPWVPEDTTAAAYLARFAWTVKRMLGHNLNRACRSLATEETRSLEMARIRSRMALEKKVQLEQVDAAGRIVLLRAELEAVPSPLLLAAAGAVVGQNQTLPLAGAPDAVSVLANERHVTEAAATVQRLLSASCPVVLLMASHGAARHPYPDEKAAGKGQPSPIWPPVPYSAVDPGVIATAEGHRAQLGASNTSAGDSAPTPVPAVTVRYIVPTFSGLAAALSKTLGRPVVLLPASSPASFSVYADGAVASDSELTHFLQECASSAGDLADVTRALAHSPFAGTVVLLENMLHPDTYAAEIGSCPLASVTGLRRHLPYSFNQPALDGTDVQQWHTHQVCLWLASLQGGIAEADAWRGYVQAMVSENVTGATLVAWSRTRSSEADARPSSAPAASSPLPQVLDKLLAMGFQPQHAARVVNALGHIRSRHAAEVLCNERAAALGAWASQKEAATLAALNEGTALVEASMRIRSLLKGYVTRRRLAQERGRRFLAARAAQQQQRAEMGKKATAKDIRLLAGQGAGDKKLSPMKSGPVTRAIRRDVRFAALTVNLNAVAFRGQHTRVQAALRALLSAACDFFIADSALAAAQQSTSGNGIHPSRGLILHHVAKGLPVGPSAWARVAHHAAPTKGLEEQAAVEIQRLLRGKAARERVRHMKSSKNVGALSGIPEAGESEEAAEHSSGSPTSRTYQSRGAGRAAPTRRSPYAKRSAAAHSGALVPASGLRVMGPHLAQQAVHLQQFLPGTTSDTDLQRPVLAVVGGGGGDLLAKCAAIKQLLYRIDVLALSGAIALAWLAHTAVDDPRRAAAAEYEWAGVAAATCTGWQECAQIVRRLAAEARNRGVQVLLPTDFLAAATPFDPLACNPAAPVASTGHLTVAQTEALLLRASWMKKTGQEDEEDAAGQSDEDEDGRADEDYDSDNSEDMRDLLAKNNRRKARAAKKAEDLRLAQEAEAAAIASRPELPVEASTVYLGSRAAAAGRLVAVPLHKPTTTFCVPDVETASFEWEWESAVRLVDLQAGGRLARGEQVIDIGPRSGEAIADAISSAGTVLLYSTLGVVEVSDGASSTADIVSAIATHTKARGLTAVAVGGALAAYLRRTGGDGAGFALVSESGSALLVNKYLPGLASLSQL